jgi:hypothetical protein
LRALLTFVLDLLRDYGLDDFYLELSTKNPEKFVGEDAEWEEATRYLQEAARRRGFDLVPDPGGARLLRAEDLRAGAGRHRPHVADVHHPGGLPVAPAVRAGSTRRRTARGSGR